MIINIFIETKNNKTNEYVFVESLLQNIFPEDWRECFKINCVNGWTNLTKGNIQAILASSAEGNLNLILFDADFSNKDYGGFEARKSKILEAKKAFDYEFELFLFPNNKDDGDFEILLDRIAQKEKHKDFFECYKKYEMCVGAHKDAAGKERYLCPNLKGKLHTYITAMPMSSTKRKKIGSGQWQFDNADYWDLNTLDLSPLKETLRKLFSKIDKKKIERL